MEPFKFKAQTHTRECFLPFIYDSYPSSSSATALQPPAPELNPKRLDGGTRNQLRRSHLVLSRMFRILINESRLRDVSKEEGRRIEWEPGSDVYKVQGGGLLTI